MESSFRPGDVFRTHDEEVALVLEGSPLVFVMMPDGNKRFVPAESFEKRIGNVQDFDVLLVESEKSVARFLMALKEHERESSGRLRATPVPAPVRYRE